MPYLRLNMKTTVKYLPTGETFSNRKEAKIGLGHANYNRALKNGELAFITTYSPSDVIL